MKCPKCGYLGFEPVDRCRNCGYEFSLALPADTLELPLRRETESRQPVEDLAFLDVAFAPQAPRGTETPLSAFAPETSLPAASMPAAPVMPPSPRAAAPAMELPLFGAPVPDDLPLITRPSPPRTPLAVRRATPDVPRLRSIAARPATLDLALEPPARSVSAAETRGRDDERVGSADGSGEDAPIAARLAAVVTDLIVLAAIDAVVLYFTLQVCGIGLHDVGILPRVPLIAFLILQNGGYLVAFTAGGQTLGKMAAGIKVVSADSGGSLDLGRALVRELVWCALALPAGLGLLTVLGHDRRGVHDRFAGTRVVRG